MSAMVRLIIILVFVTTLATGSAASPSSGVAFDQIDKVTLGPTPEAPLDTFAKDRLSVLTTARTNEYPPPGADAAQQALQNSDLAKIMKGTLRRYAYLGQWTRVDDPVKDTATITRPDLHEVVYLDLGKKTYRVDSAIRATSPNDSLPQLAKIFEGINSKAPGRAVMTTIGVQSALPSRQYEGLDLQGTTNTSSTVIDHATGSCHASNITFTMITFTAKSIADPKPAQSALARKSPLSMRDIMGGCRLKRVQADAHARSLEPKGFYVYRRVETQTKFNETTTPTMSFVSQRGNIKVLTEKDAGLFQAPADFTKVP